MRARDCGPAAGAVESGAFAEKHVKAAGSGEQQRQPYHELLPRSSFFCKVTKHELVEPQKARWFALQREMTNHQNGHRTVITMSKVTPGIAVPDETFTTRHIERD